ncbi:gfo/Idh/MocA family oxidoreductase, partial [Candidatus Poribacteria bacterium]|nr:gfo/Idh/MocA family oxidoreductase [Candidatus Poribacteria bacterium]
MGIGVGIVGLGMFGASWIHHYKIHPDVERLALCDLRADVLAA